MILDRRSNDPDGPKVSPVKNFLNLRQLLITGRNTMLGNDGMWFQWFSAKVKKCERSLVTLLVAIEISQISSRRFSPSMVSSEHFVHGGLPISSWLSNGTPTFGKYSESNPSIRKASSLREFFLSVQ